MEGDDVLFSFPWRALNEASKSTNHQIGTPSPLTCTKISVSSIVNYFHNAVKMLLSSNKGLQKLNSRVEMLEKQSADSEEFSTLVELEVLTREEQAPAKGKKPMVIYVNIHCRKRKRINIQIGRGQLTLYFNPTR
jgi:hypothetical protein